VRIYSSANRDDEIRKSKVDRACSTHWKDEKNKTLVGKSEEMIPLKHRNIWDDNIKVGLKAWIVWT
jgi:hypothetical protein